MPHQTPAATINTLIEARNRRDLETVLACYEPDAILVLGPGVVRSGEAALREWMASYIALQPTFEVLERQILETGDTALHCSAWKLHGTDSAGREFDLEGHSTDVLHRQPDGTWLIAIDNPWGTAILQG